MIGWWPVAAARAIPTIQEMRRMVLYPQVRKCRNSGRERPGSALVECALGVAVASCLFVDVVNGLGVPLLDKGAPANLAQKLASAAG